jgi:hypothetical protein
VKPIVELVPKETVPPPPNVALAKVSPIYL